MSVLRNLSTGEVIAAQVFRASGVFGKVLGLAGRRSISPQEGVWLESTWAIHTIGMQAPIDVIFLDAAGRVLRTVVCVQPYRPAVLCFQAQAVIELGSGALERQDILIADRLALE